MQSNSRSALFAHTIERTSNTGKQFTNMNLDLQGKTALVTGGSRGLGRNTVLRSVVRHREYHGDAQR